MSKMHIVIGFCICYNATSDKSSVDVVQTHETPKYREYLGVSFFVT